MKEKAGMQPKDKIKYRLMTEDDVKGVSEIEKECFSQPWSLEAFKDELDNQAAVTIIARTDEKVVGFINGRMCDGFYINNIAVNKDYRKSGVATKLLFALEVSLSDNAEFSTLEVRKSNTAAINLYKKNGYEQVGERKNFYEKPAENALLMTKYFN